MLLNSAVNSHPARKFPSLHCIPSFHFSPSIYLFLPTIQYIISLQATDVNQQIFTVTAQDEDIEANAEILYDIVAGNTVGIFK